MSPNLLTIPYDIRLLIYQHLFPSTEQIYIQPLPGTHKLQCILPSDGTFPTELLLTNHHLYAEASGYLYNNYLFNIVGLKSDCLASYKALEQTLGKHARNEVRVDAFSNGVHSSTMCISMQAGEAKMAVLTRRARGEAIRITDMESEQRSICPASRSWPIDHIWLFLAAVGLIPALVAGLALRIW